MRWEDVKHAYPSEWVLIEAIDAKTEDNRRIIHEITIVDTFKDDNERAMKRYVELHKQYKDREYYVVNTLRPELDITVLKWTGAEFLEMIADTGGITDIPDPVEWQREIRKDREVYPS